MYCSRSDEDILPVRTDRSHYNGRSGPSGGHHQWCNHSPGLSSPGRGFCTPSCLIFNFTSLYMYSRQRCVACSSVLTVDTMPCLRSRSHESRLHPLTHRGGLLASLHWLWITRSHASTGRHWWSWSDSVTHQQIFLLRYADFVTVFALTYLLISALCLNSFHSLHAIPQ